MHDWNTAGYVPMYIRPNGYRPHVFAAIRRLQGETVKVRAAICPPFSCPRFRLTAGHAHEAQGFCPPAAFPTRRHVLLNVLNDACVLPGCASCLPRLLRDTAAFFGCTTKNTPETWCDEMQLDLVYSVNHTRLVKPSPTYATWLGSGIIRFLCSQFVRISFARSVFSQKTLIKHESNIAPKYVTIFPLFTSASRRCGAVGLAGYRCRSC